MVLEKSAARSLQWPTAVAGRSLQGTHRGQIWQPRSSLAFSVGDPTSSEDERLKSRYETARVAVSPGSCTSDPTRCAAARIPTTVTFQEERRLAVPPVRRTRAAGVTLTGAVANADYGDNSTVRQTLARLQLPYALGTATLPCFVVPRRCGSIRSPATAIDAADGDTTGAMAHRLRATPVHTGHAVFGRSHLALLKGIGAPCRARSFWRGAEGDAPNDERATSRFVGQRRCPASCVLPCL